MPRKRRPLAPRKAPTQERARFTVEAILQATAYILVKDGYDRLTTNRVAERAGVNIASLYQYFPNKEALVAELRRRHVAEMNAAALTSIAEHRGAGLEATVRDLIAKGVASHRVAPALHRVFTEEMARLGGGRVRAEGHAELRAEQARWAESLSESGVPDVELALWMVDTVTHAVLHAMPDRPAGASIDALTEELVLLVTRYLRRG